MELTKTLLYELQRRLKIGNRRGVHLNAIPANSRYKFDLNRLSQIDKNLPDNFIKSLLSELPLKFKISWKNNVPDFTSLFEEDKTQLVKITKAFENLINQTEAIESEKGINTFGFGFPVLIRRDLVGGKLTVAPVLIWSLRFKRTKEFNTWEILRNEDDPIYLNEVLINHLESDSNIQLEQLPSEMLDDGLITKDELIQICVNLIKSINSEVQIGLKDSFKEKLNNVVSIKDKSHYEKVPLNSTSAFIDFGGLFSIFEVQKQNIINEYDNLIKLKDCKINLADLEGHYFQPISSVDTDPSQQGVLHSLETTRNILIQGPPGTGKSQTLTAVLINALENNKKTIVVCEKRTALEVLHNALIEKGLDKNCVLIRDIVKDRRNVVDSVRDRVDNSPYKRNDYYYSKVSLDNLISKAKRLINSVNSKHKKLDEKLLEDKSWVYVVGILLSELKDVDGNVNESFDSYKFEYSSTELEILSDIVKKGEELYKEYKIYENLSNLNNTKFENDNPYQLRELIISSFNYYQEELKYIKDLFNKRTLIQKIYYPTLKNRIKCFKEKVYSDNWILNHSYKNYGYIELFKELEIIFDANLKYLFNQSDAFFYEYYWFRFYNKLSVNQKKLINDLKTKKNWQKSFLINYLNSMLLNAANVELPVSDSDLNELKVALSGIEKEQLKYIKEYWFSKQMQVANSFHQNNLGLSVENLYNKKASFRNKRHSLRQIIQKDFNLFTTFFPIILTSPDVCSNLFKGMNSYFDIVLFDEASQLRLEDNLPSILKGKQIIIAGDEHQMPPSNYFSKVFDGSVEDEDDLDEDEEILPDKDNILLSCESLLDFASELNFKKIDLDFHYRSRHPYLIDFSNHAFYKKRLKPLPNDFEYNPIKYIQVNGTFYDHINEAEAEMVLSIIENNINRLPNGDYPSVGVATFNITQRNLIKSKILERQKFPKYIDFNNKIQELEEKGMFIKNLENIQGDERDIIIISTTYGVGKDGKFTQRFGPINHLKGNKLLNVIITRAKYKVYVCSSVPEHIFMNYKDDLKTIGSNNKKAVFYAYLAYSKAVSENKNESRLSVLNALSENTSEFKSLKENTFSELKSPFIDDVYQILANEFGENKIKSHIQFAGFDIDLVFDSKKATVPKIVIECDGTVEHSKMEAYLFDLHRQKILINHGFIFHRIWSTNWWRDPKREANRLIEFIKKSENETNYQILDNSNTSRAFTDTIKTVDSYVDQPKILETEKPGTTKKTVLKEVKQTTFLNQKVSLNSKVTVKYINNGKDLKFQIVENASKIEITNGIQKINSKSPLAVSIMGHSIGDVIKVGNLDNFVEILKIDN
jgi:superfamily I DNA and/or RNA helicase/transcription elongation GreA/GreB family factor/very-short-patch-repair endonuclease